MDLRKTMEYPNTDLSANQEIQDRKPQLKLLRSTHRSSNPSAGVNLGQVTTVLVRGIEVRVCIDAITNMSIMTTIRIQNSTGLENFGPE